MAVSKTGNAFVWGSNTRGQLGYDPKVCKNLSLPTKICLMLKEADSTGVEVIAESSQDVNMEEEKVGEEDMKVDGVMQNDVLDMISHGI